jgi:Flp pilus assembly protein TadD
MRRARLVRFRELSVIALTLVFAACATGATAQPTPQPSAWAARKDCVVPDIAMPASTRYQEMLQQCGATADDPNARGGDQAIAAYNMARAQIATALLPSAVDTVGNYVAAIKAINKSLDRLRNDHPDLVRTAKPNDKKDAAIVLANQRFRYGRVYALGRAYAGLGLSNPPASPQVTAGLCTGRDGCLMEATRQLESRDVANPFANDPADTRYDDFVLLRANTYAQLGLASDGGKARADFEELVRRGSMPGRASIAAAAKIELAKIYVRDGQAALQGQNANLGIAIDSFQKALVVEPASLEAKMGLGRAYLALAATSTTGKRESYISAATSYDAAAKTANERGLVKEEAEAREGRGQALLEQSRMAAAAGGLDASGLLQQAIDEYTKSAGLEPRNAQRQLKLARALDRAGQFGEADKSFEAAVSLLPAGALLSDALLELAAVKTKLPNAQPEVIRATYERARTANPQSAKPGFEIGMSYYKQSLLTDATREFQAVVDKTGGANGIPPPGELQFKADAYFYLSMIEARQVGSGPLSSTAVLNADRAVLVGAPSAHRNHACLAHIVRGGKSVTDDGMSNWCAASDGSSEGLLLRGMFYLRAAQFASPSLRPTLRDSAQFAFNQGLNVNAARSGPAAEPTFAWPGAPKPPSIQVLLDFGKAVVVGCGSQQTALTPLSAADASAAEAFFTFYRVFDCEARR